MRSNILILTPLRSLLYGRCTRVCSNSHSSTCHFLQVLVFHCSACKGDLVLSSNCDVEDAQRLQDNGKVKKSVHFMEFLPQKTPKTTRLPTNATTPLPLRVHVSGLFTIC